MKAHTHDPDERQYHATKGRMSVKQKAIDTRDKPAAITLDVLTTIPDEAKEVS